MLLDGKPLTGWQTFPLPMDDPSKLTGWTTAKVDGPAFHRGTVKIGTPTDTFLDMQAFGKGFAWANGHNLGRHWNIGPQRALYFPAPMQRKGENSVIVFDLDSAGEASVRGVKGQVWGAPGN